MILKKNSKLNTNALYFIIELKEISYEFPYNLTLGDITGWNTSSVLTCAKGNLYGKI